LSRIASFGSLPRTDKEVGMLEHTSCESAALNIYESCFSHPGSAALDAFNTHLTLRPLVRGELTLFLASMAAFNRHTIGGIAILAGRLSDEVLPIVPTTGHEIGAYVLDAAVDEYGLRGTVTHVELARNFAGHLGVAAEDVEALQNSCDSAVKLGEALKSWYRDDPPAFALGVHAASEVTSVKEFIAWHDIFLQFPQYRLSQDGSAFDYLRVHYSLEPGHIVGARVCIARYLEVLPANRRLVEQGAQVYLDLYQDMFEELDRRIFQ
jgi:hypothetical protein